MSPRSIAFRLSLLYGMLFFTIGILIPYWPVWLRDHGLAPDELGIILALSYFVRILASPSIGVMVDRRGDRRRPMIGLAVASFAFYALFLFVDGFWPFLALTVLAGACFTSLMPLGDNLTMLRSTELGLDYGRIRLWGSLAFIAASALGGVVLERGSSAILLWLMLAGLLAVVGGCALVPDEAPAGPAESPPGGQPGSEPAAPGAAAAGAAGTPLASLRHLLVHPTFLLFLVAVSLVHGSHMVYYGFATLHWQAAGLSGDTIGLLWAEGVVAEIILFACSGALLRRLGSAHLILLAGLAAALRWVVLASTAAPLVLAMVQGLHAFTFGACHIGAMHFIARAAPRSVSAGAQSLYSSMSMGLSAGIVMLLAGPLYGALGGAAFYFSALLAAAAAVLAMMLRKRWHGGELLLRPAPASGDTPDGAMAQARLSVGHARMR